MIVTYNKLWHLFLNRGMKKKDIKHIAGLTSYAMNRFSRNEAISTNVLGMICQALDCEIEDICEFQKEI